MQRTKTRSVECSIKCGKCCEYWTDVYAANPSYFKGYAIDVCSLDCPLLGPEGCKLPRARRPKICNHHLCEEALEAVMFEKDCA